MSLFLVVISLLLSYFSPPEISPELAKFHLQEFVLIPAMLGTVVLASQGLRVQLPQHGLIIGVWFSVVMSRLTSGWFGGAFYAMIYFGLVVAIYFLVSLNTFTFARIRIICGTLSGIAFVMAIQGIFAYHAGYMVEKLMIGYRVRGLGFLADPNDFGQFLLVGLSLLGVFWSTSPIRKAMLFLIGSVILYTVYLTFSRGAVIGLLGILFVLLSRKIPVVWALAAGAVMIVILAAAGFGGGRDYSLQEGSAAGRVMAWGSGISDLKSHPIFGVGFATFTNYNDLTAHNSFVLCFAELGIFGYFFWLALIVIAVMGLERLNKAPVKTEEDREAKGLTNAMRAALYSFLVTSWFLSRTYTETFYILMALTGSLIHMRVPLLPPLKRPAPWVSRTVVLEFASIIAVYVSIRLRAL